MKIVNPTAARLADQFTATELAHKLDASMTRASVARERLRVAWDALRLIAKGDPDPATVAATAMETIKTP